MNPIQGIHHITAIASSPQANVDFYHNLLGQRLVKKTINFDDPHTYHLYYGDQVGSPGTIMTHFPWPNARRGVVGNGEIGASAYAIQPGSLGYWRERLAAHGVDAGDVQIRFGAEVLAIRGSRRHGAGADRRTRRPAPAALGGRADPAEHVLAGFHGVTLFEARAEPTARLLTEQMGYRVVGQEGNRWRLRAGSQAVGGYVDLLEQQGLGPGRMGAGSVHHVAFRVRDDAEELAYQQAIRQAGFDVTPVRDRQYFHSIYWNEPGGVLFEIATDPPGFTWDETVEATGQRPEAAAVVRGAPQRDRSSRAADRSQAGACGVKREA
jgi:glyoxalase family protein